MKSLIGWVVLSVFLLVVTQAAPQTSISMRRLTDLLLKPSCVVTGGKLFVNGVEDRTLSESEILEFETYKTQRDNFVKLVKRSLEKQLNRVMRNGNRGFGRDSTVEFEPILDSSIQAPKNPSFCSAEVTTEYVFPGCTVQNNKVIINGQFVRALTPEEVQDLKTYLKKLEQFKEWAENRLLEEINETMREMKNSWEEMDEEEEKKATTSTTPITTTRPDISLVETPNFCTPIY